MTDLITITNDIAFLDSDTAARIASIERTMEVLKKQEEELKKALLEAMMNHNVLKLETPELVITFVDAFDRETFDSKKFRKDHPEQYDEYVKFSHVNPSVRVKVK